MIEGYWNDILKLRKNPKWKYFWWKVDFREQLIGALETRWTNDLPDLTLFIQKINDQCVDFDLPKYSDTKLYIEKLMRMVKRLEKKRMMKAT